MKIKIRYDNQTTTLDVPEEDFTVMVQMDYEDRCAKADDPASVQRRTPQEIMDERFNRPDYNNWHTHNRHWDADATPPSVFGGKQYLSSDLEEEAEQHHFTMDEFPDLTAMKRQEAAERDEEVRAWIREKMKPSYAEILIAIRMNGMSVTEYMALTGEKQSTVSQRLRRAEKKYQEIFQKCHI